jgi:DnaJ-class molecular chaperone
VNFSKSDFYATLGLDRDCSDANIRDAYRLLAKQFHPDVNSASIEAAAKTRALNAAYEILGDAEKRLDYDGELDAKKKIKIRGAKFERNVSQEIFLRVEDFLRGATLEVHVKDAANAAPEIYSLIIPPETAPGARFKILRSSPFDGGLVLVRVRVRPDFRFKIRGSDLRCDLRITNQRATIGGTETIRGALGNFLRVPIPKKISRGEIIVIAGEGLPKMRGGRGDLLVRAIYQPEVRVARSH